MKKLPRFQSHLQSRSTRQMQRSSRRKHERKKTPTKIMKSTTWRQREKESFRQMEGGGVRVCCDGTTPPRAFGHVPIGPRSRLARCEARKRTMNGRRDRVWERRGRGGCGVEEDAGQAPPAAVRLCSRTMRSLGSSARRCRLLEPELQRDASQLSPTHHEHRPSDEQTHRYQ